MPEALSESRWLLRDVRSIALEAFACCLRATEIGLDVANLHAETERLVSGAALGALVSSIGTAPGDGAASNRLALGWLDALAAAATVKHEVARIESMLNERAKQEAEQREKAKRDAEERGRAGAAEAARVRVAALEQRMRAEQEAAEKARKEQETKDRDLVLERERIARDREARARTDREIDEYLKGPSRHVLAPLHHPAREKQLSRLQSELQLAIDVESKSDYKTALELVRSIREHHPWLVVMQQSSKLNYLEKALDELQTNARTQHGFQSGWLNFLRADIERLRKPGS